jgi:hypothetical protein
VLALLLGWQGLRPMLRVIGPDEPLIEVRIEDRVGFVTADGILAIRPAPLPKVAWLDAFDEQGMAAAWNNDRIGWIDRTGRAVIPIRFERARLRHPDKPHDFLLAWVPTGDHTARFDSEGMVPAGLEGKFGFLGRRGEWVTPAEWDEIGRFEPNGLAIVGRLESGSNRETRSQPDLPHDMLDSLETMMKDDPPPKYGWIDRTGAVVIAPKWKSVREFLPNGLAPVEGADGWGAVDRAGKLVIPARFTDLKPFDRNLLLVSRAGRLGLYGVDGTLRLEPKHEDIDRKGDARGWRQVALGGRRGWIDAEGRPVIPCVWSRARDFDAHDRAAVERNGRWGAINRLGETVIEPRFLSLGPFNAEGFAIAHVPGGIQAIDLSGKPLGPVIDLDWPAELAPGLFTGVNNRRHGLMTLKGGLIRAPTWDEIRPPDRAGLIAVRQGPRWGWLDREGRIRIAAAWLGDGEFDDGGLAVVSDGKRWGCINRTGAIVVPLEFDRLSRFDAAGLAIAHRGGRAGLIDRAGKPAGPFDYERFEPFDDQGTAIVERDGQEGMIERGGNVLIPLAKQKLEPFRRGVAIAWRGNWAGAFDRRGRLVLPFEHESINSRTLPDEKLRVHRNGRIGVADATGRILIPIVHDDLLVVDEHRGWSARGMAEVEPRTPAPPPDRPAGKVLLVRRGNRIGRFRPDGTVIDRCQWFRIDPPDPRGYRQLWRWEAGDPRQDPQQDAA